MVTLLRVGHARTRAPWNRTRQTRKNDNPVARTALNAATKPLYLLLARAPNASTLRTTTMCTMLTAQTAPSADAVVTVKNAKCYDHLKRRLRSRSTGATLGPPQVKLENDMRDCGVSRRK